MEYHIVKDLEKALPISRSKTPADLLIKPSINILLQNMFIDWTIVIICWCSLALINNWLYPIVALVIASRFHSFGVILHDLTHMPLKNKTTKIRILEVLVGYPIATTLNAMRYHHLRHHKDSCMDTDPYFKTPTSNNSLAFLLNILKSSILIPFWLIRCLYGSFAFYSPSLRQSYAQVFLQDKSSKDLTKNKEVIQCAKEDIFQLLFFILIFLFVVLFFGVKILFYYYIIPALITGCFSGYRVFKEHSYTKAVHDRTINTIIQTTKDHNLSGISQFFLAPRNIGYHIVHHIHPQVAWYALPKLRKWYLKNYPELYKS